MFYKTLHGPSSLLALWPRLLLLSPLLIISQHRWPLCSTLNAQARFHLQAFPLACHSLSRDPLFPDVCMAGTLSSFRSLCPNATFRMMILFKITSSSFNHQHPTYPTFSIPTSLLFFFLYYISHHLIDKIFFTHYTCLPSHPRIQAPWWQGFLTSFCFFPTKLCVPVLRRVFGT